VPSHNAGTRSGRGVFGRHRGAQGGSAYPKAQTVLLSECGTHTVVDAEFAPCYASERALGGRLLRSIGAGMLLLFDRGFYCFHLIAGAGQLAGESPARPASVGCISTRGSG